MYSTILKIHNFSIKIHMYATILPKSTTTSLIFEIIEIFFK